MKKFMLALSVFAVIGFTSCGSDDDGDDGGSSFDCVAATQDATDAGIAYLDEASEANCNAYKNALQTLIDEDCVTGSDATTIQALIDGLTCT